MMIACKPYNFQGWPATRVVIGYSYIDMVGPASITGSGGTYPTTFAGGESLVLGRDTESNFTVTFESADQLLADVIERINDFAGYTMASDDSGELKLTGYGVGEGNEIRVVSGSTGVLTKLGLTASSNSESTSPYPDASCNVYFYEDSTKEWYLLNASPLTLKAGHLTWCDLASVLEAPINKTVLDSDTQSVGSIELFFDIAVATPPNALYKFCFGVDLTGSA